MIERLRDAYHRRKLGPVTTVLVRRMEIALRTLPIEVITEEWIESFWRLPPENWESELEARRRWKPPPKAPRPLTAEEADARFERAAAGSREVVRQIQEGAESLEFPETSEIFARAKTIVETYAAIDTGYADWLATLPIEAREGGMEICGLLRTLDRMRETLALKEERGEEGVDLECVRSWIRKAEVVYHEVAEPFFTLYGKPESR